MKDKPRPVIEILAATGNKGKLHEIETLFRDSRLPVKLYFLPDFGIQAKCPETGATFIENAVQKSLFYGRQVPGVYTIGEDSGLMVEALNGAPGIYSSRYSDPGATDERNIVKLLEQLRDIENRRAKFVTGACISRNGEVLAMFSGEVEGVILRQKHGKGGFGYDPVFYYPPAGKTFAELTAEEKNRFSHRARAFARVKEFLEKLI